jgi:hypothetical protein
LNLGYDYEAESTEPFAPRNEVKIDKIIREK